MLHTDRTNSAKEYGSRWDKATIHAHSTSAIRLLAIVAELRTLRYSTRMTARIGPPAPVWVSSQSQGRM